MRRIFAFRSFFLPFTSILDPRPFADSTLAMSGAEQVARTAKESFDASQLLDSAERHKALIALKQALTDSKDEILQANKLDIEVSSTFPSFYRVGRDRLILIE